MKAPPSVLYDIGIENIGAEIVGIMRLHIGRKTAEPVLFENLPGDQHTDALAADEARAKLSGRDCENVGERKVPVAEIEHSRLAAEHHFHQFGLNRLLFLRRMEKDRLCFSKIRRPVIHTIAA
jgi:hypothetical protein